VAAARLISIEGIRRGAAAAIFRGPGARLGAATEEVSMTIQPVAPLHLLTVAEYLAIGEIEPGEVIRASEVHVIVEVLSPGSKRTDNVLKRSEYADAGIRHYWIVDIEPPISLLACHLAGEFGYADSGTATGSFSATAPFPVEIDLDALL
jgi:hypothetical protein